MKKNKWVQGISVICAVTLWTSVASAQVTVSVNHLDRVSRHQLFLLEHVHFQPGGQMAKD